MSNMRDDDTKFDAELSAGYRARSNEMPSVAADAHILAASLRAAGSRPLSQPRRWFRWIDAPLATAAVVLVSASLLLLMREQGQFDRGVIKQAKEASPVTSMPTVPVMPLEAPTPAPAATVTSPSETRPAPEPERDTASAAPTLDQPDLGASAPAQTDAAANLEDVNDQAEEVRRSETEVPEMNGRAAAETNASGAAHDASSSGSSIRLRDEPKKERTDVDGTIGEETIDSKDASTAIQGAPPASAEATTPSETLTLPRAAPKAFPGESEAAAGVGADSAPDSSTTSGIGNKRDNKAEPPADESVRRKEKMPSTDSVAPPSAPPATSSVRVLAPEATISAPDTGKTESLSKDIARESHAPTAEEKELEAIRQLIDAGEFSDARLALARFTKAHPDYRLPDDIIEALKPSD